MKVLFLQLAHQENDDRVRYHQCVSLEKAGHTCFFSSEADFTIHPDIIICDIPLAVWRARRTFGRKTPIVYDITEWYPSKKNMRNTKTFFRPIKYCLLMLANYWAGWSANAFIFGEYYKARPFKMFFPWKRHLFLPYYPSLQYIQPTDPRSLEEEIRLLYAGPRTAEKGFLRIQRVKQLCETMMPNRRIILTAINEISFEEFCKEITHHDIFLDLRDDDMENTRCLPIKLFYYMAAGRPVIYSDLKAIRRGVPEIADDSLVKPDDLEHVAAMLCELANQPSLFLAICARNRQLAEKYYNWEHLEKMFVESIERFI